MCQSFPAAATDGSTVLLSGTRTFSSGRSAGDVSGFTLIEMLVTVSIVAILLVVTVPGMGAFLAANAVSGSQNELTSTLVFARTEAIRRAANVVVSADVPTVSDEFSGGWTTFVDSNGNGVFDGGDTILRKHAALSGAAHIGSTGGVTAIGFNQRGFLTSAVPVTLTVCRSTAPRKGNLIIVEPVGLADVSELASC